jgi:hypothetical protein
MEDYYECLHHKKEVSYFDSRLHNPKPCASGAMQLLTHQLQAYRTQQLQLAYRRAEVEHPREKEPRVGAIRNLGLIEFKSQKISNAEDTKSVLEASQSSK